MIQLSRVFAATILPLALVVSVARAEAHHPAALNSVAALAQTVEAQGQQPVVIFDLDDTLINTRERNLRIIEDFIGQAEIQSRYPEACQKLAALGAQDIRYLMADTLKEQAVTDPAFVQEISDFWLARFFTNEYCAKDQPNPGAVKYVRKLFINGTKIVYLTGRDVPRMHDGTVANLLNLGFPLAENGAVLIMKPAPTGDDLEFKKSMFASIAKMGTVVGVFENEPANVNAHHDAFPGAIAIFLDTIHSPKPDVPEAGIEWVGDFQTQRRRSESY